MKGNTTILISKNTREKIKEFGKKGETYSEILDKMCQELEMKHNEDLLMNTDGYMTIREARQWTKKQNELEDA